MGKQSTRKEILEKLHQQIDRKIPILVAATGSGLNAKAAEIGGADLIMVLHTGRMRQMGMPSIAATNRPSNEIVREMFQEQFAATQSIPLLAGVDVGQFPADGDLNELIDSFMDLGFSGIVNFLSAGEISSPDFVSNAQRDTADDHFGAMRISGERQMFENCRRKEENGVGFAREVEMIRLCRARDIFTTVYVFSPQQAAQMAAAGADAVSPHCGGTSGGLVGHAFALDYDTACARIQSMFDAARAENPEIILLGHGGPFSGPEDTIEMYRRCNAQGFTSGSGIDRIPIEDAVINTARAFKSAGAALCDSHK